MITNCPNCGAPVSGAKCEYCGTPCLDLIDIAPGSTCGVRLRDGDKEIITRMRVDNISARMELNGAIGKRLPDCSRVTYFPGKPEFKMTIELADIEGIVRMRGKK